MAEKTWLEEVAAHADKEAHWFDALVWIAGDPATGEPRRALLGEVRGWVDFEYLQDAFSEDGLYFLEFFLGPEGYDPLPFHSWTWFRIRPSSNWPEHDGPFRTIGQIDNEE